MILIDDIKEVLERADEPGYATPERLKDLARELLDRPVYREYSFVAPVDFSSATLRLGIDKNGRPLPVEVFDSETGESVKLRKVKEVVVIWRADAPGQRPVVKIVQEV